jgi:arylformamidase
VHVIAPTIFFDLTQAIEPDMPGFPGSKPVVLYQEASLDKNCFNEIRLHISTHTGTHLDCGYHILSGGSDTFTTPLENFYGSAMTVNCLQFSPGGIITREYLRTYEDRISSSDFVLLHTGWSRFWGTPRYYDGFPVLDAEAANYLTSFRLKGLGCDTISFDPVDSKSLPVHHIILSSGMILVENLVNLEILPACGFIFSCLPLRIKSGDGSPVRAVGIVTSKE